MKKKSFVLVSCLILVMFLVSCSEDRSVADASSEVKIAVVMHAMNSSFYTKLAEGAQAAGKDLGIKVDVTSPTTASDLAGQVSLLESCIVAGYDGIATVTWDLEGFNSVIKKAQDVGIPVVSFNMDAPSSGTKAFIGQDFIDSGYQLGKYMFEEEMDGEGKYIIASCSPADTALVDRAAGLEKAATEYPEIELISIIDIGTDLTDAYGVIENAYLANPDVKAIIGVDVFSEAIGIFIAAQKLQDSVLGGGYDLTEGSLKHVSNGDMKVVVGQNPFNQGYYSVIQLYNNIVNEADFVDMNTGTQLVTIENVASVKPE